MFSNKCIILLILHSKFLYANVYIPNNELEIEEDNKVNKNSKITIYDINNIFLKKPEIICDGCNAEEKNIKNVDNESVLKVDDDFKINLLDDIKRVVSKSDKINHSDVQRLRTILSIITDSRFGAIRKILRSRRSYKEHDLENAENVGQYLKKWNSWLLKHHINEENKIQKSHSHFHVKNKHFKQKVLRDSEEDSEDMTRKLFKFVHYGSPKSRNSRLKNSQQNKLRSQNMKKTKILRFGEGSGNGRDCNKKPKKNRTKQKKIKDEKEKKRKEAKANKREVMNHELFEIMKFLQPNMMSTRYIFYELKRIEKTGQVKNILREMVSTMEQSVYINANLADDVLKCYKTFLEMGEDVPIWNAKTNNLVINYLRDSPNDGVR